MQRTNTALFHSNHKDPYHLLNNIHETVELTVGYNYTVLHKNTIMWHTTQHTYTQLWEKEMHLYLLYIT